MGKKLFYFMSNCKVIMEITMIRSIPITKTITIKQAVTITIKLAIIRIRIRI